MTTIKTLSTREEHMRDATLHIIGTGPGDPDLLTLKALKTLKACPIIAAPKATPGGSSTALAIVSQVVDLAGKDIFELYFPMKKIRAGKDPDKEVSLAWQAAAARIIACLDQGLDVAFPTLGDPAIYSTGYYLYDTLLSLRPDVRVKFHAGIPAMSCCSAETKMPICLGNEMLAVVPATFSDERLRSTLEKFDTIVLMKVHRVLPRICRLLQETGLLGRAVLIERAGMKGERIIRDLSRIPENPHYFSTMIIRRNGGFQAHWARKELEAESLLAEVSVV
ncbi:MAG TPA: precorrin-2 C(20)-methyltransferase [Desulfoprunum sp.]|nr:precorrin-2 C(20)-methyltransferase [Desulfoprunum sp.]